MNNSGSDFSTVKVGDRLWYMNKEIVVDTVFNVDFYPIYFRCNETPHRIDFTGRENAGGPQVLFYSKVEIVPPPRPKRMVKKTVMVRPYLDPHTQTIEVTSHLNCVLDYCGPVQTIEIEVEE